MGKIIGQRPGDVVAPCTCAKTQNPDRPGKQCEHADNGQTGENRENEGFSLLAIQHRQRHRRHGQSHGEEYQ